MGLGILTYLHSYIPLALYLGSFLVALFSAFWKPKAGLFYLICLIPFTFSLVKAQQYPFGNQLLDIIWFSIFIGAIKCYNSEDKPNSLTPVIMLMCIYFIALLNGFFYSDVNAHVDHLARIKQWKNFIIMPILYYLTYYSVRDIKTSKQVIFVMLVILLIVEWKFYKSCGWLASREHFSYQMRGGQFGYLGQNEFAAFILNYVALGSGILLFSSINIKLRIMLFATLGFGIFCLLYSFSRGAYVGIVITLLFFSLFSKKIRIGIALLIIVGICGTQFLPQSVVERITMTQTSEGEIESSAGGRLMLWTHVIDNVFSRNPIIGVGYGIFKYVPDKTGQTYGDPHSNYMETLAEQGIIGVFILLFLYYSAWKSGWLLYKLSIKKDDKFIRGAGLGFCGCVLASMTTNLFGDRWTHYQVMTYFWILWAIVDRMYVLEPENNGLHNNGNGNV